MFLWIDVGRDRDSMDNCVRNGIGQLVRDSK